MIPLGLKRRLPADPRIVRPFVAAAVVLAVGTFGYAIIEGWSIPFSLFFTLISLSTVGYGDYGLSARGEAFTVFLLLGGIGILSYALGQVVRLSIENQLSYKERKMRRAIELLADHYIICGLGRLGQTVCERLSAEDVPFVAIDGNADEVAQALERGHAAMPGDATEDDCLLRAGIERAAGLICASGSDTENIVITLSARGLRPDVEIVARAEHEDSVRKLERAGATRVISPVRSGGARIVDGILRPHLSDFLEWAKVGHHDFEMAEVKIEPESTLDGRMAADYREFHPDVVVVAMRSDGQTRVGAPADRPLRAGDVLFVAGRSKEVGALCVDARISRAA